LYQEQDASELNSMNIASINDSEIYGHSGHAPSKHKLISPPVSILEYPPLAYFVNGILTGFNFICDCPLYSLKITSYELLENILLNVSQYIANISHIVSKSKLCSVYNNRKDGTTLDSHYISIFRDTILPFLIHSFENIFDSKISDTASPHKSTDNIQWTIQDKANMDLLERCKNILLNH
jgi:hypothetical protein